jgi:hypothetical protein
VGDVRKNHYPFISERALDACSTYEAESIPLVAVKAFSCAPEVELRGLEPLAYALPARRSSS